MGGNVRHADKGPDRRTSQCSDCGEKFQHRKFSHPDYCPDCREERQKDAGLETEVRIETDADGFDVTIRITNPNDVPVEMPVQSIDGKPLSIIGYIRVVGDDFAAEDAIIRKSHYGSVDISPDTSVEYNFNWVDGSLDQDKKPRVKYDGVIGEELRDRIAMARGDPTQESELAVMFMPTEENKGVVAKTYDGD